MLCCSFLSVSLSSNIVDNITVQHYKSVNNTYLYMYPYAISMLVYIDGYYGIMITTTDVIDIADTCIEMHQSSSVYTCVNRCSILLSVPLSNYIHVFQSRNYSHEHNKHIHIHTESNFMWPR